MRSCLLSFANYSVSASLCVWFAVAVLDFIAKVGRAVVLVFLIWCA